MYLNEGSNVAIHPLNQGFVSLSTAPNHTGILGRASVESLFEKITLTHNNSNYFRSYIQYLCIYEVIWYSAACGRVYFKNNLSTWLFRHIHLFCQLLWCSLRVVSGMSIFHSYLVTPFIKYLYHSGHCSFPRTRSHGYCNKCWCSGSSWIHARIL